MRLVATARIPKGRGLLLSAAITASALLALDGSSAADVNVSNSGWAWSNPTPQGRTLHAVAFSSAGAYAVGDGGTALFTPDAGRTWGGLVTGTSANLERVQALSPSTIVVGGAEGCALRISVDGGQIFKRIFSVAESHCEEPVAAFSFVSPQVGFLLLENGAIDVTADGGETFSRRTSIPGTPTAGGGGGMVGADVHFLTPTSGIAFVRDPSSGASAAYATADGGVSWAPVTLPPGARVTSVHFVDAKDAYAIGPETLLRTTDGGQRWESRPIGRGNVFSSIDCASAKACILTVSGGTQLVETADGGETDVVKAISSVPLLGAGYASPSHIVAVGANGATMLSGDGGVTFSAASTDIGGEYSRVRAGPPGMLLAPGAHGQLALSVNGGASWQVLATQSTQRLVDVAFGTPALGYALDSSGALQRPTNAGASWATLATGSSRPPDAVVALGERTALLIGPVGIRRASAGGRFVAVRAKLVAHAHLSDYDLAGTSVFAFGRGTHTLLRSTGEGERWRAVRLPLAGKPVAAAARAHRRGRAKARVSAGVAIRSVAFTSAQSGMLLDTSGRLWSTQNGGRSWSELLGTGTGEGVQLAFAEPGSGFMSVRHFGGDGRDAYVLHTTDGGRTWHPQEISAGSIPYGGLVAGSGLDAAALLDAPASAGAEPANRLLFATGTGGDVAGTAEPISLSTRTHVISQRNLRRVHYSVRIEGALSGASGGELIVVSHRNLSGGGWQHERVIAGANGGSFGTTWTIRHSCVFVAQWAGESGRPGQGSAPLRVIVSKR